MTEEHTAENDAARVCPYCGSHAVREDHANTRDCWSCGRVWRVIPSGKETR